MFRTVTRNVQEILSRNCCATIIRPMMSRNVVIENHPSILELTQQLAKAMGVKRGYKPIPNSRQHLQTLIATDRSQLPERTMRDSYTVAAIPLGSNVEMQEAMVSITGQVRKSVLLETMDIFAVIVAQNYIKNPKVGPEDPFPYTLVTALVNRIDFTDFQPRINSDIKISGHVSWVGQSSLEVIVWLEQKSHDEYHRITKGVFLLACRDAINSNPATINPLKITNDYEALISKYGNQRKHLRLQIKKADLTKSIPSQEEQKIVHDKFKQTVNMSDISLNLRKLPTGCAWMSDCVLSNVIHSHPVNRNLHNTVFGGFLMRQATDLATTLTWMFSKHRPRLKTISDINFSKPVSMTSLLRMFAHVVYTKMNFVQITVYAEVYDLFNNETVTTNSFHLTYEVSEVVPEVFPMTYNEAMMFVDGRRHFQEVMQKNSFDFEPVEFDKESAQQSKL